MIEKTFAIQYKGQPAEKWRDTQSQRVKVTEQVKYRKPASINFPQVGWMSGETDKARLWLGK
jgi:hypothetical protein